jgi:hypothetical protein
VATQEKWFIGLRTLFQTIAGLVAIVILALCGITTEAPYWAIGAVVAGVNVKSGINNYTNSKYKATPSEG